MKKEKNLCEKVRKPENPYETWIGFGIDAGKTYRVLKKYQIDDFAPGAKYYCFVDGPSDAKGKFMDVVVWDIKKYAYKRNEVGEKVRVRISLPDAINY